MVPDVVLLTDHAWSGVELERQIVEEAGYRLIAGPAAPAASEIIEALVREHRPVAIMTCWAQVSAAAIASGSALRVITRLGVGLDNISVATATERGVWVSNVPDYCVEEVSDHAVGLILARTRGIAHFDAQVKAGVWSPSSAKLQRLANLTVGLIGHGRIGRRLTDKLQPFQCRVLVHVRSRRPSEAGLEFLPLDRTLRESDIVVIVAPLSDSTRGLFNSERINQMRIGAFLVNVSRGALVDNDALVRALENGTLSGAALDVVDGEPEVPPGLLRHPGVILTPHVAFSSDASLAELRRRGALDVVRVLAGQDPKNPCNEPRR